MPILVRYGALVQPLLPPQRPPAGRPRHDHHTVLSGIIRVIRRRDSWRAVPRECGKWEMVYQRYQLWRAEGRWQRIAAALGIEVCEVALQGCVSEVLAGLHDAPRPADLRGVRRLLATPERRRPRRGANE